MANGIQNGLANGAFVEGENVTPKEAILKALPIVAKIDSILQQIAVLHETFAEFDAILRRPRPLRRTIFENEFSLRQ